MTSSTVSAATPATRGSRSPNRASCGGCSEMEDNPVHGRSAPDAYWSTANLAEAMPGVLTPLGWSVWGPASELGARHAFYAMGAIPAAERSWPVFRGAPGG